MDENKEAVERTYGGIASLLLTVEHVLKDWEGRDAPKDKEPIEEFERYAPLPSCKGNLLTGHRVERRA